MFPCVALSVAVTTTVFSPSVPGVPEAAFTVYLNVLVPWAVIPASRITPAEVASTVAEEAGVNAAPFLSTVNELTGGSTDTSNDLTL